jgi:hypothetical protein
VRLAPKKSWHELSFSTEISSVLALVGKQSSQFKRERCSHYLPTVNDTGMPREPEANIKGGGQRGGPRRWDGSGPRPARHIPWPEVCFRSVHSGEITKVYASGSCSNTTSQV